jgi:hypothetical protein
MREISDVNTKLTNPMEQSSYREANSHLASQQIPRLLWNPKQSATGPYPEPDESSP